MRVHNDMAGGFSLSFAKEIHHEGEKPFLCRRTFLKGIQAGLTKYHHTCLSPPGCGLITWRPITNAVVEGMGLAWQSRTSNAASGHYHG